MTWLSSLGLADQTVHEESGQERNPMYENNNLVSF